ncbi:ABC transporter permease [Nocardioides sp. LHD-245]|uniref:ABC transporter permease n=1 Tax=Nocardioides sp. LHD-245 TaxID=3051387 RepID=UPI0027E0EEEE|nr:ABC transporter permease [Nocardioides sp. LHD-245]
MMSLVRSEWTKLRSLRSTWLVVLSTVVAGVALSVLGSSDFFGDPASSLPGDWDPTATSLKGFLFAQLLVGMLGALAITNEQDTGTIGTSLAFVPSRARLLAAKTIVLTAVALGTALVTTLASFFAVQLAFDGTGIPAAGLTDPGVVRALLCATLYLTLVALAGIAVGVLGRSATASLAVLVGVLLLVPALGPGLPGRLGGWFEKYWPITAGQASYDVVHHPGALAPGAGLGILALVVAGTGAAALTALRGRDV